MRYQIYKPNSKNNGCAMNFNFGKSRGKLAFYVNAIKQHSWDADKRTGSFFENSKNSDKNISCKFSPTELGEMAACFKNKTGWSTVHDFNGNKTVISLVPKERDSKVGFGNNAQTYKTTVFGLSISKNGGESFFCYFTPGEVESIKVLINSFLQEQMKEADAEFLKNGKNNNQNSNNESSDNSDAEEDDELPDF